MSAGGKRYPGEDDGRPKYFHTYRRVAGQLASPKIANTKLNNHRSKKSRCKKNVFRVTGICSAVSD